MPVLYDSSQAAELTDRARVTVLKLAARSRERGKPIGERKSGVWLFTPDDIKRIRAIPKSGGRPVTTGSGLRRKRKPKMQECAAAE